MPGSLSSKKETLAQVFSCNFAKFSKTLFYRTPLGDSVFTSVWRCFVIQISEIFSGKHLFWNPFYSIEHLWTTVSTDQSFLRKLKLYSTVVLNEGSAKNDLSHLIPVQGCGFTSKMVSIDFPCRSSHLELFSNILEKYPKKSSFYSEVSLNNNKYWSHVGLLSLLN